MAAAAKLREIGAEAVDLHARMDPVLTKVPAPAIDWDSKRAAAYLARYAQQCRRRIAQAAVILAEFADALDAGAARYAGAEADNAKTLN